MLSTENLKWFKVVGMKISFEHVDFWVKSLLFRTHHLRNSTSKLILIHNHWLGLSYCRVVFCNQHSKLSSVLNGHAIIKAKKKLDTKKVYYPRGKKTLITTICSIVSCVPVPAARRCRWLASCRPPSFFGFALAAALLLLVQSKPNSPNITTS